MAEGCDHGAEMEDISKRLSRVHLDLMDEEDNYVPSFIAKPTQPAATPLASQTAATVMQQQPQHATGMPLDQQQIQAAGVQQQQSTSALQQQQSIAGQQQGFQASSQQQQLQAGAGQQQPMNPQQPAVGTSQYMQQGLASLQAAIEGVSATNLSTASQTSSSSSSSTSSGYSSLGSQGEMVSRPSFRSLKSPSVFSFDALANQFWSDPSFMSSYIEATFRPRAAQPNEVTILIPNIFNLGETLPVNIPKQHLTNIYMTLIQHVADPNQAFPPVYHPVTGQNITSEWLDFIQNPPVLPSGNIPPRRNVGIVQQGAVNISPNLPGSVAVQQPMATVDASVPPVQQSGSPAQQPLPPMHQPLFQVQQPVLPLQQPIGAVQQPITQQSGAQVGTAAAQQVLSGALQGQATAAMNPQQVGQQQIMTFEQLQDFVMSQGLGKTEKASVKTSPQQHKNHGNKSKKVHKNGYREDQPTTRSCKIS